METQPHVIVPGDKATFLVDPIHPPIITTIHVDSEQIQFVPFETGGLIRRRASADSEWYEEVGYGANPKALAQLADMQAYGVRFDGVA